MKVQQIRDRFVEFFEERGHVPLQASSLIPTDPTVLFTTAGMQQFKEWYSNPGLADETLQGKGREGQRRVVTIQPCFRTSDIEEIGDETHLTFFEMLGHFSFSDYWKKDAIEWAWEFITTMLKIDRNIITVTYFGGQDDLPPDEESLGILKDHLRLNTQQIIPRGKEDNFWGPVGEEGPCGPTVEFHVNGVEIWNTVFNQYYLRNGIYEQRTQPNVDMGGGLERIAMIVQGVNSVFETDELKIILGKTPPGDIRSRRIIADHIRAIAFLVTNGIEPSKKDRGHVLHRLIHSIFLQSWLLRFSNVQLVSQLLTALAIALGKVYPALVEQERRIKEVLLSEEEKFNRVIKVAERRVSGEELRAKEIFDLYQTHGIDPELTEEIAKYKGIRLNFDGLEEYIVQHAESSTVSFPKKFKGGLVEVTPKTTRLHTAHHLLLAALRKVLGDHVVQRGSNITEERLRIDFSHQGTVNREQITEIEDLVNQWIKDDLRVIREEMSLDEAYKKGALGEFGAQYPERVSVYLIGNPPVSIEICGGPHVKKTAEINGRFKIIKEESSSAGVRRMRGVLEI